MALVPMQWAVVAALMVGMMGVVLLRNHLRQPQPEDESEAGHPLHTRLAKSLAPAQVEASAMLLSLTPSRKA